MSKLFLVRGISGSGKSTYAKTLVSADPNNWIHLEADMFWVNHATGEYEFDASRLGEAHAWCQNATTEYLALGYNVVVSNTFTALRELRPYFSIAKNTKSGLYVVTANGAFKDVHNVPEEALKRQRDRFVHDLSPLWEEFYKENE